MPTSELSIYYRDELITLYHGDCLEYPELWTMADVLVTDPPYGMRYETRHADRGSRRKIVGDHSIQARDDMLTLWGDRPAIVFGKWSRPRPTGVRQRLIWDKRPCGYQGDCSMPWATTEEEIYVLGQGFSGPRVSNIVAAQTLSGASRDRPDHPTPKPVGLMEKLIERCPPGLIADPFAGSGSTLRAAKNLGRRAIGFEIEESYCEIAAGILSQEVLFT